MNAAELPPTIGVVACLGVIVVLAWPYLGAPVETVGTYYASGLVTPLIAGVFALVGVIVFAAGREGRSDPALVAGVGLVLGLFIFLISLGWALTARPDVIQAPGAMLPRQRWVLVLVAVLVPLTSAWYARELEVV